MLIGGRVMDVCVFKRIWNEVLGAVRVLILNGGELVGVAIMQLMKLQNYEDLRERLGVG